MPTDQALGKYQALVDILAGYGSVGVAFSGGVDSALLLHAAHEALGGNAIALIARSRLFPQRELDEARAFCADRGIEQHVFDTRELEDARFAANPPDRCYLCKHDMLEQLIDVARRHGARVIVEGSNVDDDDSDRPGSRAVRELGVESPLRLAGLSKAEIRALSRAKGLPTWDKQSYACLATRFEFGEALIPDRLEIIDQAERHLIDLGFRQVRVRYHGKVARIELGVEELQRALDEGVRLSIVERLRDLGFEHVTLDLAGYGQGGMS